MNLTQAQIDAIDRWYKAQQKAEIAALTIKVEQKLRKEAFAALGLSTDEGTQTTELPEGWALKYKTPYKREVDARIVESLRAPLKACRVSLDSLIEWEPKLKTKEYRELTAEAKKIFDACLTTTTGMPTLELVAPKDKP